MENDFIIKSIFSTPIYVHTLNKNFTEDELNFVNKIKDECNENYLNKTSINKYVLEEPEFKNLKNILNAHVKNYYDKILSIVETVTPYITQSWLNYTKKEQSHHKHFHPNSIVSGVLYFNADINTDKIYFHHPIDDPFHLGQKEFNLFNSESWYFPVETGVLIMFPSRLKHNVPKKIGDNLRISLAFNTFVKGLLGDDTEISKLKI